VRSAIARFTGSVRWRSTFAAVVVTAVALGGAALVLLLSLRATATTTVLQQVHQRASEVAAQLTKEGPAELAGVLDVAPDASGVTQVIGPDGTVVAHSVSAGFTPMSSLRPPPGQQAELRDTVLSGENDAASVAAIGVRVSGQDYVVLAAQTLGSVRDTIEVVSIVLGVGFPLLLLVVGVTVYRLVGRALAPVEAIRAEVSAVQQADLSHRVPEPRGQDEIARLARTMNAMLERLQRAQRSQRQFVADASHELRSPLATLRTHLDLASVTGGRLDDVASGAMSSELTRLSGLVDDMLLLARADERGLSFSLREVDLDDVLDAERVRLGQTTDLQVPASIAPVKVMGDRAQLTRMVRNLTDNAARYAKSSVRLVLRVDGAKAILEVSDDGPGIPEQERERVFHRFVRLDDARSSGSGGLGLAIVTEIAAAYGGSVRVGEGPDGTGALLVVELPAVIIAETAES
jgi:signal transduction histidine kinase